MYIKFLQETTASVLALREPTNDLRVLKATPLGGGPSVLVLTSSTPIGQAALPEDDGGGATPGPGDIDDGGGAEV